MKIEAVTVCVGYADFLSETVAWNRPLFDRWLIVTADRDADTKEVCRRHNLEFLVTDDFWRAGAKFDKARAVDRGLQLLAHADWVLHLDADIVVPPHARQTLEAADLDPRSIYGADRIMVRSWERWQEFQRRDFLDRTSRSLHHNVAFPGGYDVGARWADIHAGYVPIGFFQLFHRTPTIYRGIRTRRYSPHGHSDAARTDVQFALQWDRRHRVLLPEVVVAHLESEQSPTGANWAGRTSKPFGPPPGKPGPGPRPGPKLPPCPPPCS